MPTFNTAEGIAHFEGFQAARAVPKEWYIGISHDAGQLRATSTAGDSQ